MIWSNTPEQPQNGPWDCLVLGQKLILKLNFIANKNKNSLKCSEKNGNVNIYSMTAARLFASSRIQQMHLVWALNKCLYIDYMSICLHSNSPTCVWRFSLITDSFRAHLTVAQTSDSMCFCENIKGSFYSNLVCHQPPSSKLFCKPVPSLTQLKPFHSDLCACSISTLLYLSVTEEGRVTSGWGHEKAWAYVMHRNPRV